MRKTILTLLAAMLLVPAFVMAENLPVLKIGVYEPASGDSGAGGKQETLGVQEKIIQLKVSEGKAGQTPKELRSAEAQGTAAPPHSSPGGGQPLTPLPTPPGSWRQVTCK